MKYLAALLVLVTVLATRLVVGFSPAFISPLKRQTGTQQFGMCSLEETQDIFVSYPGQCYSAFASLKAATDSDSKDTAIFQQLYATLCTEECTQQIVTFTQVCEAQQYTDPFLHACDQNTDNGDYCLAASHKNDGAQAATECYTALATARCPDSCRASLEQLKTDLGCCVNSLFNTTTYGLDRLRVASHELWELCQVSNPPECDSFQSALLSGTPGPNLPLTLVSFVTFIRAILFYV